MYPTCVSWHSVISFPHLCIMALSYIFSTTNSSFKRDFRSEGKADCRMHLVWNHIYRCCEELSSSLDALILGLHQMEILCKQQSKGKEGLFQLGTSSSMIYNLFLSRQEVYAMLMSEKNYTDQHSPWLSLRGFLTYNHIGTNLGILHGERQSRHKKLRKFATGFGQFLCTIMGRLRGRYACGGRPRLAKGDLANSFPM